jgi:hypothetical protein
MLSRTITLILNFKEQDGGERNGFIWVRIGASVGLL